MEQNQDPQSKQTKPRKISDPGEAERILRQYAGIFPNAIPEFAEKIAKKVKVETNYAR